MALPANGGRNFLGIEAAHSLATKHRAEFFELLGMLFVHGVVFAAGTAETFKLDNAAVSILLANSVLGLYGSRIRRCHPKQTCT